MAAVRGEEGEITEEETEEAAAEAARQIHQQIIEEHNQQQRALEKTIQEEEAFLQRKRKSKKGNDSDETEVIKIKTDGGRKNKLRIGNSDLFIKDGMKEEMEGRIRRKAAISEEELFIFYALNEFERYLKLDRGMVERQREACISYQLEKYAGPWKEVSQQVRDEGIRINLKCAPAMGYRSNRPTTGTGHATNGGDPRNDEVQIHT